MRVIKIDPLERVIATKRQLHKNCSVIFYLVCRVWYTSAPRYQEAGQLAVNTSFPNWAVDELRLSLKGHQHLKKFVRDCDNIDEMPLSKLLELASTLKINLDDVITRAERWGHSLRYPAFTGHYLFDIAFELLSIRVVRKACVEYEYTP